MKGRRFLQRFSPQAMRRPWDLRVQAPVRYESTRAKPIRRPNGTQSTINDQYSAEVSNAERQPFKNHLSQLQRSIFYPVGHDLLEPFLPIDKPNSLITEQYLRRISIYKTSCFGCAPNSALNCPKPSLNLS